MVIIFETQSQTGLGLCLLLGAAEGKLQNRRWNDPRATDCRRGGKSQSFCKLELCPGGHHFSPEVGACYWMAFTSGFDPGRVACRWAPGGRHGAGLASVHSLEGAAVVRTVALSGSFIGLKKEEEGSGNWTWTDGSGLDFENWEDEEQDVDGVGEYCVEVTASGKWRRIGCSAKRPSVCKRELETFW